MPSKIILTVNKGKLSGKTFIYEGKESLILGRQDDCAVVLPEDTVSRCHCVIDIDIAPPSVMVRDFGSRNGTYLNGAEIGRRNPETSAEEARKIKSEEFAMKSGDRLGLGKDCEISLEVRLAQSGAHNLCEICGGPAMRSEDDTQGICVKCRNAPHKLLEFVMDKAKKEHQRGTGGEQDDTREIAGYKTIKMLGEGGMGSVWLVEDEATGDQRALKLMLPKVSANERSREIFLREAILSNQLVHKNIVLHDKFGRSGETYFILMEVCKRGSLHDFIIENGGKLSRDLATDIILQVLDGLIYAHIAPIVTELETGETIETNGIVHRDLKPGNILLTKAGGKLTAKISDFGLSKAFELAGLSGHTSTGTTAGSPAFMPRQQIIDYKYSKPAVDVWAAAAVYYFMLTGKAPKDFTDCHDAFAVVLYGGAVPIQYHEPSINPRLAAVIDGALVDTPDIGVKSAAEFKKMIEEALNL